MNDSKTLKRLDALVRARTAFLNQDHLEFARLMHQLRETEQRLIEHQNRYMAGVNKINEIRQSPGRKNLNIFEEGTDLAKNCWIESFREKQLLENRIEKMRLSIVRNKKFVDDLTTKRSKLAEKIEHTKEAVLDAEQNQLHLFKKYRNSEDINNR